MSPNHPAPARRSPLLLSLLTLLATLAAIAVSSAQAASAPTLLGLESAVGLQAPLTTAHVRPSPPRPLITRQTAAFAYDQIAVATSVAAKAADRVLPSPEVVDSKLQNIVRDLYKGTTNPGRVGNGTTADAVRNEIRTGQPTGGTFHTQKAQQYVNALKKRLASGQLDPHDSRVARSLLNDLQDALGSGS